MAIAGTDWARIGGIAAITVAVFTGITAVIAALAYRHGRTVAGQRWPLRIRNASASRFLMNPIVVSPAQVDSGEWDQHRMVLVHIYNHSDSEQYFGVLDKCRVVWPRRPKPRAHVMHAGYGLPPHGGGVMAVVLGNGGGEWPKSKCWVWLRLVTSSGFRQRRLVRGTLIDYDARWSPLERSPGLPPIPET